MSMDRPLAPQPTVSLAAEALWVLLYGHGRTPNWPVCLLVEAQMRQFNYVAEQASRELAAIVASRGTTA